VIRVSPSGLYKQIADDIADLKNKGHKLIAVICKTASQCRAVYQSVAPLTDIGLISNRNEVYYGDVVVIPSYLAKGLEFDAVLVSSIEDTDYSAPEDRRLLYTVCTRALHELHLYYLDTMSGFVSGIDEKLYTVQDLTR
jgi:DNA helicase-2/ATP-dependent DNA helicase PcrA